MAGIGITLLFFAGEIGFVMIPQLALAFLIQATADKLLHHIVNNREHRHADDHTHNTPQTAAEDNGKQNPEAGQAGAVAQDGGANDVSVQLLQCQNKEAKPEALDGSLNHDQKGGRDAADEGAEERNDICNTNNGRHQ